MMKHQWQLVNQSRSTTRSRIQLKVPKIRILMIRKSVSDLTLSLSQRIHPSQKMRIKSKKMCK